MQSFSLLPISLLLYLLPFISLSSAQQYQTLSPSQSKTLLRVSRILQYPSALSPLSNSSNFCSLPQSPYLTISCSNNQITQLIIIGDRPATQDWKSSLSTSFSIDAFFTTLARLSSLTVLSLVSLGMWGPLPGKVDRFDSLRVLNLSSNYIYGELPKQISTMITLQNLVLSRNFINGTVPDLKPLTGLTELDLSFNRFGPDFPSLSKSIVKLDLKNNSFHTKIPETLGSLTLIQEIDFSFNQLTGFIPSFLFSLPSIQHLDFSHNNLTGQLPSNLKCSNRLEFIDVSNNLLSGSLPSCMISNSTDRIVDYSWNCLNLADLRYQHPNSYCNQGALAAVLPPPKDVSESKKSNKSLILGIVGGIVGGIVIIGLLIILVFRKAKSDYQETGGVLKKMNEGKTLIQVTPRTPLEKRHVSQVARVGVMELSPYRILTIEEIEDATNNFDPSNLINNNSREQQYKGRLQDGTAVVVTCLKLKQKYTPTNLVQYMEIFPKLRHRHLVSIIGHSVISNGHDHANTTCSIYLVSEYISNGTLRSHLTEWRKREMLKWPQRVTAAIGVARGLQFLHENTITRNNINTESVLLDHTLTAKICNYNLPFIPNHKGILESPFSLIEDNGSVRIIEQGQSEDIYRLGLILLEIITGKSAESENQLDSVKSQLEKGLTEGPEKLRGIVDPAIRGTFAFESLRTVAEITLNCLSKDLKDRPSIDDVLWNLQYSVQVQEGWACSENLSAQL